MAFVRRFMVQTLTRTVADEIEDEDEAVELANKVDGDVVQYRRPATDLEAKMLSRPEHQLQAAE